MRRTEILDRTVESTDRPAVFWRRQPLLLAVTLAVVACFAGIGSHHIWSPDEPTGAAVGREMMASGDLVVPRLNGQPFLEKPPLYWWVEAAALRRWGISAAVARLPSALFSALTLLVAFELGRRLNGRRSGWLTVAVLGSTALFVAEAQRVVVDPALAFFVALSHLGFVMLVDPATAAERRRALWLIALAVPLAFLSKGVVALALGVAPPTFWLVATRRRRALRDLATLALLGVPVFALVVVPWAVALFRAAGWPAVQECLLNNTLQRFAFHARGTLYGHTRPVTYYLATGPAVLLPWSIAIPAMLKAGLLRSAPSRPGGEARALLFGTFALGVVLLSAAASKRELYLLPLLPAFSACVAWWLDGMAERSAPARRWDRATLISLLALASALPLVLWVAALGVRWMPARRGLPSLQAALTPGLLAGFGLIAAAACGLLLARLRRYGRDGQDAPLSPLWVAAPFLLLFLSLETGVQALVDPVKSMRDMTTAVARLLPGDDPVPAYVPPKNSPESVCGIISFDLGRRTLLLRTPDELRALVERKPGARVVLRADEAFSLPTDLTRRLVVLYDERGRKASPFVIVGWRGVRSHGGRRMRLAAEGLIALALLIAAPLPGQAPPAPPAAAAPQRALSLDEVMTTALAANPALAASRLGRAEAQARRDVAGQRPNPELAIEESRDTPRDSATFSLPIERGGKRRRRLALAEAQGRSGEAEIARLTAQTRNQVRRAYFALAAAQRRAAEAAELQRLAESARDAARARFEVGDVPRLDVLQAELAAAQAAGEADKAQGLLAGARADLNALLRRPLDSPLAVSARLDAGQVPPPEAAVRLALSAGTELSALELGIAQQQAQVELARAEAVPDVTASAGVTHYAPPDFTWGWRGGVTLPLPIFTRNRAQARLEEATLARLRAERDAAVARVRGEVFSAAANAEVQRRAYLRYRDEILPRAAEVESMAEDSYRSGQTGLVALLQSLQSVHDLRLQAVQAGTDYQNALADLERAIGAPLP